jgi:SpoVK/Ycf46/Vps4 family AAA+-type ATPase
MEIVIQLLNKNEPEIYNYIQKINGCELILYCLITQIVTSLFSFKADKTITIFFYTCMFGFYSLEEKKEDIYYYFYKTILAIFKTFKKEILKVKEILDSLTKSGEKSQKVAVATAKTWQDAFTEISGAIVNNATKGIYAKNGVEAVDYYIQGIQKEAETQKTLANMNNKTQKLSEFMEGYKENLDKAIELKDLALPNVLKETIERLMNRIKNPQAFVEKGGVTNNAILLYGPPGTGKTTVAKAITKGIKNAELFSIDLSTIQGKYVGESEANLDRVIKNTCQYAKLNPNKKIVLLMDEFDSVITEANS